MTFLLLGNEQQFVFAKKPFPRTRPLPYYDAFPPPRYSNAVFRPCSLPQIEIRYHKDNSRTVRSTADTAYRNT